MQLHLVKIIIQDPFILLGPLADTTQRPRWSAREQPFVFSSSQPDCLFCLLRSLSMLSFGLWQMVLRAHEVVPCRQYGPARALDLTIFDGECRGQEDGARERGKTHPAKSEGMREPREK